VRNLDKYNTGMTNWKQLAMMLCLLKSPMPTEKEGETYYHDLIHHGGTDGFSALEHFIQVKCWFD